MDIESRWVETEGGKNWNCNFRGFCLCHTFQNNEKGTRRRGGDREGSKRADEKLKLSIKVRRYVRSQSTSLSERRKSIFDGRIFQKCKFLLGKFNEMSESTFKAKPASMSFYEASFGPLLRYSFWCSSRLHAFSPSLSLKALSHWQPAWRREWVPLASKGLTTVEPFTVEWRIVIKVSSTIKRTSLTSKLLLELPREQTER